MGAWEQVYGDEEMLQWSWEKKPQQQVVSPTWANSNNIDYKKASVDLASSLYSKNSPGVDQHSFAKSRELIDTTLIKQLDSSREDYARELYKQKYWQEAKDDLSIFIQTNQATIDKNLYESLVNVANKQGMDLSEDSTYKTFVSQKIKDSTPIEKEEWFWTKAGNLAKSVLFDTAVGTAALATDSLWLTDNLYKNYFGERTNLTGKEWFGAKAYDLFISQWAIIDYGFWALSLATGWLAAPALLSAKTALWFGTKTFTKTVSKLGIEWAEDIIMKRLGKWGDELFRAMATSWDDFVQIATKQAKEMGTDIPSYLNSKKMAMYGLIKDGTIPAQKAKEFKSAIDKLDSFGAGLGMSSKAKSIGYLDATLDMLGMPTQALKLGTKTIDGVESFAMKPSFAGATFFVGLPATTLIGWGVGDFMQDKVFRTGNYFAEKYTEATRGGIIETERQKIIEQYGVDPEKLSGEDRMNWENYLNYRMKYANPSEIITGTQLENRSTAGKWTLGVVDTVANMVGVIGGMKAMGRLYGVAESKLSPITTNEYGEIVSNIPFLRELEKIKELPANEQWQAIESLKKSVEEWGTSFATTIKTVRELELTIKELNEANENVKWVGSDMNSLIAEHYQDAIKKMEAWDTEGAKLSIDRATIIGNQFVSEMMNPQKYQDAKNKIDMMNTYLSKVRSAESFHDELIKWSAVNFFTTHITSPSAAFVRGTDGLVAWAMKIFDDIKDTQTLLHDAYAKRSEYIKDWNPPKEGFGKALVEKIQGDLVSQGMKEQRAMEVAGMLHDNVHMILTQLYLTNKEYTDTNIGKLYDQVFTNFGIKTLSENLSSNNLEGKWLVDILRRARSMDGMSMEKEVKISDALRSAMSENALNLYWKINETSKPALQQIAIEIMQLDRLKADLGNKIAHQRELEQKIAMFKTGDIVEVQNPKQRIEEMKEQWVPKEEIAELEKAVEEWKPLYEQRVDQEEVEAVKESPMINHLIADSREKVSEKVNEAITKIHEEWKIIEEKVNNTIKAFNDYREQQQRYMDINDRLIRAREESSDNLLEIVRENKYDDSTVTNENRLASADDFVLNLERNINEAILQNIEHNGGINIGSIKGLAAFKDAEVQHIYNTVVLPLAKWMRQLSNGKWVRKNNSELTAEDGKKLRNAMQFILDKQTQHFDRDSIIRLAKEASDVNNFIGLYKESISNIFPLSDVEVDSIMKKYFGETADGNINEANVIPTYNLYKRTQLINKVKVDIGEKGWSTIFSNESPQDFHDEHGNLTSHYRLEGINEKAIQDYDMVFLDKISIDWKEVDLGEVFRDSSKEVDKKDYYNNEIFLKVSEEMEKKWYSFLGSFQEEWKKNLFVRSKAGEKVDPIDVLSKLIDTDLHQLDKIDEGVRSQILQNLSKYMKLSLWAEVKVDNKVWESAVKNREEKGVIHLMFDDSKSGKNYDGRVFNMAYLNDAMNITTGADSSNVNQKAATVFGNGTFIKAQDERFQAWHISDPNIFEAFVKAWETHEGIRNLIENVRNEFGDGWKDVEKAQNKFINSLLISKYVDRIVPLSAYKNIYTRWIKDKSVLNWLNYEDLWGGAIKTVPIDNIGLKAIDFHKDPKYTSEEQVSISNQFLREFRYQWYEYWIWQDAINRVTNVFNQIRADNFVKLTDIMKKADKDPILTIYEIEKEFGIKFDDYEKSSFLNSKNIYTMWNMASNLMKRSTLIGTQMKWNSLDLTWLPNYEQNAAKIEAMLPENAKGKWMVVSREYYGHMETFKDSEWYTRIPILRYPIVDQKVINAPYVVFAEDLWLNIKLNNSAILSSELVSKVEWDFDGDKIYAIADSRLMKIPKNSKTSALEDIYQYNDALFEKTFNKVNNEELNVFQKKYESIMDELKFNGIATYEGKANIGIIDKRKSEYVRLVNLWLLPANQKMDSNFAQALQRAVDNKTVDFKSIDIESIMPDNKLSSLGYKTWDKTKDWNPAGEHYNLGRTIIKMTINGKEEKINLGQFQFRLSDNPTKRLAEETKYRKIMDHFNNLVKNKKKEDFDDKWYINISIKDDTPNNKKMIEALQEASFDRVLQANKKVQWFFGKKDFNDDGTSSPRRMLSLGEWQTDIRKQYEKLKPEIELLQKVFGNNVHNDPQLSFLIEHGKIFETDFSWVNTRLNNNINNAWSRAKIAFNEFGTNDSELIKKIKEIQSTYRNNRKDTKNSTEEVKEQKLKNREEAMRNLMEIRQQHPEVNIDNILLSSAHTFGGIIKDLLSESTKQKIDSEMTKQVQFQSLVDLSAIHPDLDPNKIPSMVSDFDSALDRSLNDQFMTFMDKTPAGKLLDSINTTASIYRLSKAWYSNEQITRSLTALNRLDKSDAIDILYTIGTWKIDDGLKELEWILIKEEIDELKVMEWIKEVGKDVVAEWFVDSQKAIKTSPENNVKIC